MRPCSSMLRVNSIYISKEYVYWILPTTRSFLERRCIASVLASNVSCLFSMCGSVVFFLKSALLKSASGLHIDIDEIEIAPPPNRWRFACCRYLRETATIVDHSKSQATQIIKVCLSNLECLSPFFHHRSCSCAQFSASDGEWLRCQPRLVDCYK